MTAAPKPRGRPRIEQHRRDERISTRIDPATKQIAERKAASAGRTLGQWLIDLIRAA